MSTTDVPRRTAPGLRSWATAHSVALAAVATAAVHLTSLTHFLGADEGGYAFVARFALHPGNYLYGPQWVDRPPGLIAVFGLADLLGPYGVRLMSGIVAVVLVLAISDAARTIGGTTAARWTAWTAFALASSALLAADSLDGEIVSAAFVSLSVAGTLRAVRAVEPRRAAWVGGAGGAAAATAVLMKQNFIDGFAFAAVLLAVSLVNGRKGGGISLSRPRTLLIGGSFLLGTLPPLAAAAAWAMSHGGLGELVYAMYGFRRDATALMANSSWTEQLGRLKTMTIVATASGLVILLGHLALTHRWRWRRLRPLPWAVTVATVVALVGIAGGANFWDHYLIALVPMVSLVAGFSARAGVPGWRRSRALIIIVVAITAFGTPWEGFKAIGYTSTPEAVGRWIGASAAPTDTLTVLYTHAEILHYSGLAPAYPYAWSLPIRTLDPDLSLLTATLDGPDAPTWVAQYNLDLHAWGLDPLDRATVALLTHYRKVADFCGRPVWLHNGVQRHLAPMPDLSGCDPSQD